MSRTHPSDRTRSASIIATAALVAIAFVSFGAFAAPPEDGATSAPDADALPPYDSLDANKDGIVTLPEVVVYSPSLAARITHCDTNGDKHLSREEYAACHPKTSAPSKPVAPASR